jgi:NAD(P)-dependent dehydrogenase (short-subunit alcohol dehydrogenase family)
VSDNAGVKNVKDKVILITGAASGIGRATALRLAREGARLVVCDVNQHGLDEVARELGGALLLSRRVDVSDRAAMRAFADEVHALVPAVDVLVNNAGVGLQGGILDTSLDDWDWILKINLGGVVHGCHFFVPRMVERGRGGHVVNVSSVLGYFGAPGVIGYATSKFGVLGLSESLRAELAPRGIAVSTICPGIIDTGIIASTRFVGERDGEGVRAKVQSLYKKRKYGPEKVAESIARAIRRGTPVVPVSPEAWALYLIKRITPGLGGPVGRFMAKQVTG